MSIQDIQQKINTYIAWKQLFWIGTIFGLIFLVFGFIAVSLQTKTAEGVHITTFEGPVFTETSAKQGAAMTNPDTVYASKSGTRYYYADCSGLKRIKPENLISFASAALAEQTGLTKAANCH